MTQPLDKGICDYIRKDRWAIETNNPLVSRMAEFKDKNPEPAHAFSNSFVVSGKLHFLKPKLSIYNLLNEQGFMCPWNVEVYDDKGFTVVNCGLPLFIERVSVTPDLKAWLPLFLEDLYKRHPKVSRWANVNFMRLAITFARDEELQKQFTVVGAGNECLVIRLNEELVTVPLLLRADMEAETVSDCNYVDTGGVLLPVIFQNGIDLPGGAIKMRDLDAELKNNTRFVEIAVSRLRDVTGV